MAGSVLHQLALAEDFLGGGDGLAEPDDGKLLTADVVAHRLGVPRTWVYAESRAGRIPTVRLGRYVRYRRAAVDAWILMQEVAGDDLPS